MRKLREDKIASSDWNAIISLTEDADENGQTCYETSLEIVAKILDTTDFINGILRNKNIVRQMTEGFRKTTIERGTKAGSNKERLGFAKVTIVPKPFGDYHDDATKAYNTFKMELQILAMVE